MAVHHGVGVNWGVYSSVVGVNGAFQAREHSYKFSSELVRDAGNTTVSKVYYDPVETATFTYVAAQPVNYTSGNAPVDIPTMGTFIQVVDNRYPAIAGYWLVDGISVVSSNTTAARVTLQLSRHQYMDII